MIENPGFVHNMSSYSRSYANIQPRQIPPRPLPKEKKTAITGQSVQSDLYVSISLPRRCFPRDNTPHSERVLIATYRKILRELDPGNDLPSTRDACEEQLRGQADQVLVELNLVGCIIVSVEQPKQKNSSVIVLRQWRPALALLSKSSTSICVVGKTPNLSLHLLARELWTRDPRIIALAEGS